ncbi:MAG: acyl-CoA dehydrogenase family protein [Alphaproteobacteria bacterium]|jgi:acyl-CoA dehydrogenase|nr:acyl-CoA dehydrogenase family protein [Alphaproteobacteria bacterium]MDP6812188.1 acyl-CoA dehydrogenase family protein [Alphaproteobacteria bacterium]|tara:strand:+ start:78 stop:410 length:333 start_codon:yes stop_codon:yes gene_type:complete
MIQDQETFGLLLDGVGRFVDDRLNPAEDYLSKHDDLPDHVVREMRELGLFGLSIPMVFGGLGPTLEETVLVVEALYRDARILRICEGASDIQRLVIARETLRADGDRPIE